MTKQHIPNIKSIKSQIKTLVKSGTQYHSQMMKLQNEINYYIKYAESLSNEYESLMMKKKMLGKPRCLAVINSKRCQNYADFCVKFHGDKRYHDKNNSFSGVFTWVCNEHSEGFENKSREIRFNVNIHSC